jgi:hypothetical protein
LDTKFQVTDCLQGALGNLFYVDDAKGSFVDLNCWPYPDASFELYYKLRAVVAQGLISPYAVTDAFVRCVIETPLVLSLAILDIIMFKRERIFDALAAFESLKTQVLVSRTS